MFPVFDVSRWERHDTEQMGTKPKFWCLDPSGVEFLFKESRRHSGEHWSEKVAAELAAALALPHAEIELATCDGKTGTISRNFLPSLPRRSLVHGNELLFEHDPNYPRHAPNFRLAQHTLDRIVLALQSSRAVLPPGFVGPPAIQTASDLFVGYLLLDALIGNTDRHHANWAVMISPQADGENRTEIAPTFDHASSLGRELSDLQRTQKLAAESQRPTHQPHSRHQPQTIVGYLQAPKARGRIYSNETDRKPLHPLEVFRQAQQKLPVAAAAWLGQLDTLPLRQVALLLDQVPLAVISRPARDFAFRLIELNRSALLSDPPPHA